MMRYSIAKLKQTKSIMTAVSILWLFLIVITYVFNLKYYLLMGFELDLIYINIGILVVVRILCSYINGKYRGLILVTSIAYSMYFVFKFNHYKSNIQIIAWLIPIVAAIVNNYIIEEDNDKIYLLKSVLLSIFIEVCMLVPIIVVTYIYMIID